MAKASRLPMLEPLLNQLRINALDLPASTQREIE